MKEKITFRKGYRARSVFHICNVTIMIVILVAMLVPMLKVLSDSLDRTTTYGLNLWPKNFSISAYQIIFSKETLYRPFLISVYVMFAGTFIGLTITTLGAYVLNKRDLVGRDFLSKLVFITMIFNGGLVPTFLVLKGLHLTNSLWSVLLPLSVNVYNMVLMRNFFDQIPMSLFESAEIDGATPFRIFLSIVLPLSKAALASIGLFFAVIFWNEFFSFIMYITNTDLFNFQIKLREMILNEQNLNDRAIVGYGDMVKNAAVIVAMIPFLIIYPFVQRYFMTGVTMGAVKE